MRSSGDNRGIAAPPRCENVPDPPHSGGLRIHVFLATHALGMTAGLLRSLEVPFMDRSAATAREIILEIVRNMRDGLEPLHYSTLAPAIYHVYLHSDDMDRLRGILPRIVDEATRALNAEVESLNRASMAEKMKLARRGAPKIAVPDGGWQIQILENTDEDVSPGDITIYSELALPAKAELGAGSMTKRIATRRLAGVASASQSYDPPPAATSAPPAEAGAFAVIEYEDKSGR